MVLQVLYFTVFSVLSSNVALFQVSAEVDSETLSQIVRNHSNILNEFPDYVEKTKSIEKEVGDFEQNMSVYENYTNNVEESIIKLKETSGIFTEKLENFESYTNRTDQLESDVIHLLETAETFGGTLSSLEVYSRRTKVLEDYINKINNDLKITASETNTIIQNLESSRQTHNAKQIIITAELAKLSRPTLQGKQQEIAKKLNDVVKAVKDEENATSEIVIVAQQNYSAEQRELKSKVLKLNSVIQVEEDITKKLKSVVTQFEEQKKTMAINLESLQNSFDNAQSEIKSQLQKINPLIKTKEEIINKLNNFVSSLNEAKVSQQTLQKNVKELGDQIQQYVGSHISHYY